MRRKIHSLALISAALVLCQQSASAAEPDMKALARQLAGEECAEKLPDGTCPDSVETRQIVLPSAGKAATKVAKRTVSAIRQNISMTFVLGSAELTADAKAKLDVLARELVALATYRPFTVEGHTDRSGSFAFNQQLSVARARAVVDYLAANGVDRGRMTPRGYGYSQLVPGHAPDSPAHRRVVISAK